jgi:hypothetical protein
VKKKMAFWSEDKNNVWGEQSADEQERQRREAEINSQYGLEQEEEQDENWLKKIVEYLRQKKSRDAQKMRQVV